MSKRTKRMITIKMIVRYFLRLGRRGREIAPVFSQNTHFCRSGGISRPQFGQKRMTFRASSSGSLDFSNAVSRIFSFKAAPFGKPYRNRFPITTHIRGYSFPMQPNKRQQHLSFCLYSPHYPKHFLMKKL